MIIHLAFIVSLASLLAVAPATASAIQEADPAPPAVSTDPFIQQMDSEPHAALEAATRARDAMVAAWPSGDVEALVAAVERHAIAEMIAPLPASARSSLTQAWSSHPEFVAALARVYTDRNDGPAVASMAQAIAAGSPESASQYPELAAAVCVVLDRPRAYPGLGAILPAGHEVFDALVFAHQDRRVAALPLDQLPAEIAVYLTDTALTGEGIRKVIQDRRRRDPLELYHTVPYVQAGLLAGEAAPPPEDFTFDRIAERGGLGPLRSFYAEQLGQAFGYPVALATGHFGDERFLAPVFLEGQRRTYTWNLEALPDHPNLAFGTARHPVTGEPLPLPELVLTADLASRGPEATRKAWALLEAAEIADATARPAMVDAALAQTTGFARAWAWQLEGYLAGASAEPEGRQRVLSEFLARVEPHSPLLATSLVLEAIAAMRPEDRSALLEWMAMTSRRDPNRYAAAQLALGDLALERGDRAAAMGAYEDLLNRQGDATPLAVDALARLEAMLSQDGRETEIFELYGRTHRGLRSTRTSQEAEARASAFMIVGERFEKLLMDAGREREAERLRRRLDQALP